MNELRSGERRFELGASCWGCECADYVGDELTCSYQPKRYVGLVPNGDRLNSGELLTSLDLMNLPARSFGCADCLYLDASSCRAWCMFREVPMLIPAIDACPRTGMDA